LFRAAYTSLIPTAITKEGEMERRFVIKEWGIDDPTPGWTITEAELKHRLQEIIDADHAMEDCIEILIYGHDERR